MDQSLMGYVGAFIAVAIMLGIGTLILGGAATDCTTIIGYSIGEVSAIPVSVGGNYTTTAPTGITISAGGGSLATATVQTGAISGGFEVTGVTVTEGGEDYTSSPTLAFTGDVGEVTPAVASATISTPTEQVGWAGQCLNNNAQSQAGYNLLIIVLIVLAAVVVLTVVRMLS